MDSAAYINYDTERQVAFCEKVNILLGFKMGRFSSSNRGLLGGFIAC